MRQKEGGILNTATFRFFFYKRLFLSSRRTLMVQCIMVRNYGTYVHVYARGTTTTCERSRGSGTTVLTTNF